MIDSKNARSPQIHLLSRSDLSDVDLPPQEILGLVEKTYRSLAEKSTYYPPKLAMAVPDGEIDAITYSMLGYDATTKNVGFRATYRQGHDQTKNYYPTISLFDNTTGHPFVMMDCLKVGGTRTPAVTAIIAKHCASPAARSVLVIGTGSQGTNTFPYLLTALPNLEKLRLFGTHPDGIAAMIARLKHFFPNREVEIIQDVEAAAGLSDIVVVASGRANHAKVKTSWLKPGGLLISVASKGLDPTAWEEADYTVVTSESQFSALGFRLNKPTRLPLVNAELPDVVAGIKLGRANPDSRVFAFNSGLIVADIPIAHAFASQAIAAGRGQRVDLWN